MRKRIKVRSSVFHFRKIRKIYLLVGTRNIVIRSKSSNTKIMVGPSQKNGINANKGFFFHYFVVNTGKPFSSSVPSKYIRYLQFFDLYQYQYWYCTHQIISATSQSNDERNIIRFIFYRAFVGLSPPKNCVLDNASHLRYTLNVGNIWWEPIYIR